MTSKFLKAKHWQLFVLIFGIPMIIQGFGMVQFFNFFLLVEQNGDVSPEIIFSSMSNLFGIMMTATVLIGAVVLGWFWSIGIGLQTKIPDELKMKTSLFKAALIFPAVYLFLFLGVFGFVFYNIESLMMSVISPQIIFMIFPLHLLAMIAMIYTLFFVAKTIKTAETQRESTFGDFIGEFFMVWFLPIGIWFLQPKINQIYEYEVENHEIEF